MSNILKRLGTPKKRTNMNYYNRQQFKESNQRSEMQRKYPNPKADIQLKAMMF